MLDTTTDVPAVTDTTTQATTTAPRVTATYDIAARRISYSDGVTLDCSALTGDAAAYAMLRGADIYTQGDQAKLDKLIANGPPAPRGEKKESLSVRQQAVVNALVEASKKAETPHTIETATIAVKAMDAKTLNAAHRDPGVVKHLRKLKGEGSSLLDLVG